MFDYDYMKTRLKLDRDSGSLVWISHRYKSFIGKEAGCLCPDGYVTIKIRKNNKHNYFKAHRLAWLLEYKKWPQKNIDHINGSRNDNRIVNLREATPRENNQNTKKHRDGKLVGACFCKDNKKWRSLIEIDKKTVHLGYFATEMDAHLEYMNALRKMLIGNCQ